MLLVLALALTASSDGEVVTTAPRDSAAAAALSAPATVAETAVPSAADAQPHGLTTAQQIDLWTSPRSPDRPIFVERADEPVDDRQMHGWVEGSIGTGGYRSYGAAVSLPVGENGRLGLMYRESRNEPYGYWGDWAYPSYGRVHGDGVYGFGERRRSMGATFSWNQDGED
jgi:hypothetical protein